MEFQRSLSFFFIVFVSSFLSSCRAYRFYVGGKNGWLVNPSEDYNHWAERNRFQINDTLFFKYEQGSDSVLVVSKEDYENCYTKNPILKLDNGDSEFKFERSGPFYFISGRDGNCGKGQKLIVVVLALRSPPAFPSSSPPFPPLTPPSSPPPQAPEPSMLTPPSTSPTSPFPSPQTPPSGSPGSTPLPSPEFQTPAAEGPISSPVLSPPPLPLSSPSPSSTIEPSSSPSESTQSPPGSGGSSGGSTLVPAPSGSSALTVIPPATLVVTVVTVLVCMAINGL